MQATVPGTPQAKTLTAAEIADLKGKAQAGDVTAQVRLGRAYENGNGVRPDDEVAVKWYRAAAEQGDAEGQNSLGVMYRLGHGVGVDKPEAVKWYLKAADQGYAPALFNLAVAYYNGDGIEISDESAYAYFSLAARHGVSAATDALRRMESELSPTRMTAARTRLAMAMLNDAAVKDVPAAIGIFTKLADNGDAASQMMLAQLYREGREVPQDYQAAYHWCERASANTSDGLLCQAQMLEEGQVRDGKTALELYKKAAKRGNIPALRRLAHDYMEGSGLVPQDKFLGHAYLLAAANAGDHSARTEMDKIIPTLSKKEFEKLRNKAWEIGSAFPRIRPLS